ncbi:hypothetical protein GQ42DRAFT_44177 [Ramicandelaber brevisporus]|nr:hypothetical protein GQ42DRAFT_44177 [Ramicandelaber brevisporus]
MKDGDKQSFMDAIAGLHGLRSLDINMNTYILSIHLERLAKTLVIRQCDPSKQSLRELVLFSNLSHEVMEEAEMLWADLGTLVQTLSSFRPAISLKIDMCGSSRAYAPTPAQMDILRPRLTRIPEFDIVVNADRCMALHNRQYFSPSGTCDDPLVFDQLDMLSIGVCCASPPLFDYSDFTPAKFPVMRSMDMTEMKCNHRTEEGAESAVQTLLAQEWPELKDLSFKYTGLTLSVLDKLIELNPQLTNLATGIRYNTDGTDGVFMLERVTGRLPHLTKLIIYGGPSMQIDSDWLQAACFVDICSSKLTCVSIHDTMLIPRLFEVLFALPNLQEMTFWNCILTELELIMSIFNKHRQTAKEDATVGITRLTITNLSTISNWSAELILELIAALPHLNLCTIYANHVLRSVIRDKYPKTGDIGPISRGRVKGRLIFNPQGQ